MKLNQEKRKWNKLLKEKITYLQMRREILLSIICELREEAIDLKDQVNETEENLHK